MIKIVFSKQNIIDLERIRIVPNLDIATETILKLMRSIKIKFTFGTLLFYEINNKKSDLDITKLFHVKQFCNI